MFFSSLDVPTKSVPLSEYIVLGRPLREINLLRASMKFSVDREVTNSKCTARKTAQVNSKIQDFVPSLRKRRPHKSTPVISKIRASLALSSGRGGVSVVKGRTVNLLRMMHSATLSSQFSTSKNQYFPRNVDASLRLYTSKTS
ncbi:hypothetical protein AVEN_265387-1 [Araneus ventricosus]|uniref:Uncharacterized protein n=1 Tax=Araneus ventricosus TaxID=182803 RepID=A0A4Y2WDE0_ARAVE|nr:hypothetical protein AVEN_265387-1 [Araneus ventricosus]